jgi:FixJ family two-component response regulator
MESRGRAEFVHLVDDYASFRGAMERRLRYAGYEVATYESAEELLARLPSDCVPACLLLDVRIPGMDGLALQLRLGELGSTLPIIFLTGYPDIPTTVRAIKAGAVNFLTKPVASDDLLQAVEQAIAHHDATHGLKRKLDDFRTHLLALTPRERQVFDLVVCGYTNKHIGRALGCTERTIKAHRHRVMEKMLVRSVAELVSLAKRVGVMDHRAPLLEARPNKHWQASISHNEEAVKMSGPPRSLVQPFE